MHKTDWKATSTLLAAMIIWSTSFVALKATFSVYDPLFVIWGRQIIAATVFLVIIKSLWKKCRYMKGDFKLLLLMAVFEPCLYFIFEARALTYTTASQAGIITSALPMLVAVVAFFILKEKTTIMTWTGFFLAVSGSVILSVFSDVTISAPDPILGNFLEFCAMICATGYTICLKRLCDRYNPFFLTGFQCFTGSVFFLPLVFLCGEFPARIEFMPSLGVAYLGIAVTIGAYGLYSAGMKRVSAGTATAFINLIPVFTIFFGWLFLGEKLNMIQYFACVLVFAGIYLSRCKD
jgi:drug/metabolite transporter (DMT)-like permease